MRQVIIQEDGQSPDGPSQKRSSGSHVVHFGRTSAKTLSGKSSCESFNAASASERKSTNSCPSLNGRLALAFNHAMALEVGAGSPAISPFGVANDQAEEVGGDREVVARGQRPLEHGDGLGVSAGAVKCDSEGIDVELILRCQRNGPASQRQSTSRVAVGFSPGDQLPGEVVARFRQPRTDLGLAWVASVEHFGIRNGLFGSPDRRLLPAKDRADLDPHDKAKVEA